MKLSWTISMTVICCMPFLDTGRCDDVGDGNTVLAKLQRTYWERAMKRFPYSSTRSEIYKYNDQIANLSIAVLDDIKDEADEMLKDIEKIPATSLSEKNRDEFTIFRDVLSHLVSSYKWSRYGPMNLINFIEGFQTSPNNFADNTPFDTRGDFENYVVRLQKLPVYFSQILDRLKEAVKLKHTYHEVSMRPVPAQIDKMLTGDEEDFPYYKPLKQKLDNADISEKARKRMRDEAKSAVKEIKKTLVRLKKYITEVYMKHTRTSLGLHGLENGKELYKDCMKYYLTLDLSPEYVRDQGLAEVRRIQGKMKKIMRKQGHHGSIKEYFDNLKQDSRFFFNTSDEIIAEYKSIINDRIQPKLKQMFKKMPNLPLDVRPSPYDGPFGYYSTGSDDGSKPGVFYLNTFRPKKMITIDYMALALHEANPGHHFQLSLAKEVDIPAFRRRMPGQYANAPFEVFFYAAFTEGWALYAEKLGEEMGLYKDDYELMGRYSSEMFRACRLVVDTGIHYFGWTRDEAIDYFLNYTAFNKEQIAVEVDRYSTWPGQALSYKIGEIKIVQLRQKAMKELGSLFDIKEFHYIVLNNGRVPLKFLDETVTRWIKGVKKGMKKNSCTNSASLTVPFVTFIQFLLFHLLSRHYIYH